MNVSAWSIRNPVPAILLFALLTILGLGAFRSLGIQNFPDIEVPVITISATQEGAAPSQLETEVARKIEDAVASLGGVEHVRTTLTDGQVAIRIEFVIDKNADAALNEVRNAVDSIRVDLPQDMNEPVVSKRTTSGGNIIAFAVTAPTLDEADLSWLVDNELAKAVTAVPGVGSFTRVGGIDREIQVDLDPLKLAALGVSASDVSKQLRATRRDASGGRGDIGDRIQTFRTQGAASSLADLAALEIVLPGNRRAPLADLARITDAPAERSSIALLDGKPVVGFQIARIKGWSEVTVAEAVRVAVANFSRLHPEVQIEEAYTSITRVQDNFKGSMELLYEGALLAVLVVWWFLRDWRATLVSAAALPLSIIPAFLVMKLWGFSLDTLTLLALALVVGILVDDAIVEVENIVRHLHQGKPPLQAATEAADEIGLAVIATTLTLVAVFLPTAFMGGVPGKFFKSFGITAAAAVFASLMVARLLTPMMAAYLLRPAEEKEVRSPLMQSYLAFSGWCLQHRHLTTLTALAFFVASLAMIPLLPTGFIPAADRNQTSVNLELAPGTPLSETRAVTEEALRRLQNIPEITRVFAVVGSAASSDGGPMGGGSVSDVRKAVLTINLVDRRERPMKQSVLEDRIRTELRGLPATRVALISSEPGSRLTLTLAGDDAEALTKALAAVEADLRRLSGLGNITSNASLERPEIHLLPDFARAADLGVTAESMAQAVRLATAGDFRAQLPKINLPQRQVPVRVRMERPWRENLDSIRQLPLPARQGTIPLAAVAEVRLASGPSQIDRLDRLRRVSMDVELGGRVIGEVLQEVNRLPSIVNLPVGVVRPSEGDAQRMGELFGSFATAMGIGILCIYIVLVLLFHDFLQPVTILAALPLSLGGAFGALLLTGNAFSMPAVIGLLMLMGIVTKNSILLVEYAIVARRDHGMNRLEALLDACHKRARPIVMTTVAMGAGMFPVAMGWGAEPSFRSPMAIVVIGGLLTSTVLSLVVIPVLFTYVDDLQRWLAATVQRQRTAETRPAP